MTQETQKHELTERQQDIILHLGEKPIVLRDVNGYMMHVKNLIEKRGQTGFVGALEMIRLAGISGASSRQHQDVEQLRMEITSALLEFTEDEMEIIIQDATNIVIDAKSLLEEVIQTQPTQGSDAAWEKKLFCVLKARQDVEHILASVEEWNRHNLKDGAFFASLMAQLDDMDSKGEENVLQLDKHVNSFVEYEDEELTAIQQELMIPEGPEKWWRLPFTNCREALRNDAGRRFNILRMTPEDAEKKQQSHQEIIRTNPLLARLKDMGIL